MKLFLTLTARDVRRAYGGGVWLPTGFFVAVAMLYPFAVGPDRTLLARTGGGVLLIAALLASLLTVERAVRADIDDGGIDQLVLRGISEEVIALAKLVALWLSFAPPLLVATIPAAALLGLDGAALATLACSLLLATPGLAGLALIAAALTAGLRGAGGLAGLVILPLAVPLLIFGAGALLPDGKSALGLLTAVTLVIVAVTPFAAGAALRSLRE